MSITLETLNAAIEALECSLIEVGGCDHEVGICMCKEERALVELRSLRGDVTKEYPTMPPEPAPGEPIF